MDLFLALPTVKLGLTGRTVTRVGLGGEGVLRTRDRQEDAQAVISAAIAQGIVYFDTARAYADSELYYGSIWARQAALRPKPSLTSKSAARDAKGARRDLTDTLVRLRCDYLDLWQIHDVRTPQDLEAIAAPGGALEAFLAAKQEGLVRHIGVTGHHDPAILTRAVNEWPVETVLLPANPMEGALGGFFTETIPAARAKGLGVIGMKALGGAGGQGGAGGGYLVQAGLEADALLRYAIAQPIDVLIVGCATIGEVRALAQAAHDPLDETSQRALVDRVSRNARELAGYRGTA